MLFLLWSGGHDHCSINSPISQTLIPFFLSHMKPLLSIFSLTALNSLTMGSSPVDHIFRLNSRRLHSVAAARPELIDPDFYHDNYNKSKGNLLGPSPMADTEGSAPRRGVQWAFIGSPRSKRSVYAVALSKFLKIPRISMGCLVRQELGPSSSLYKQIADAMNCGEIVSEEIILELLSKRLDDGYSRGETGFILDGVPRSQIQAEILDQLAEIDLVVNFRCTENLLVRHLGETDWKEELQAYTEKSKPLEDYYRKQKKLLDFQVASAPWETWKGLLAALHLHHIPYIYDGH